MLERICPTCLSYMYIFTDIPGWLKCPSCSFCKKEGKSMIAVKELLGGTKMEDLSPELQANAIELLKRLNLFRAEYGLPMYVNSGYRTLEHNKEIGGAASSSHLTCQACDFRDNDGELKKFIANDPKILERCDLYMETPESTPTWVHLQSRIIKSGKRIFKP